MTDEIGRRIKQLRKKRGYNQSDLAQMIGVNPVSLSYWESGAREVKLSMLAKIAEALGATIQYFYEDDTINATYVLTDAQRNGASQGETLSSKPIDVPLIQLERVGEIGVPPHTDTLHSLALEYYAVGENERRGYAGDDVFAVRMNDSSMEPYVSRDDRMVLAATELAYHGDMVCARIKSMKTCVVRWFGEFDGKYYLIPENNKFEKINREKTQFRIVGKVLSIHRPLSVGQKKDLTL